MINHQKNIMKRIAGATAVGLLLMQFYILVEPAVAAVATDAVIVTLIVDAGITITTPADVSMAPNIGVSANTSIGTVLWNVKTNVAAGYTLAIKAQASPALVSGGNSFADYTPGVADTPELWSVPSGSKEFGYSAHGTDVPTVTWGTPTAGCGTGGAPDVALKYQNTKTVDRTVATRATVTPTTGIDTTVCFAAEQNTIYAAAGTYTTTITATATTL